MRVCKNGKYIDIPDEEIIVIEQQEPIPYKDRVVERIRERYSVDDEIAILRQKDTKPDEWAEYNAFVEQIKAEEKPNIISEV